MKKILLAATLLIVSVSASAQLRDVRVIHEADTLIHSSIEASLYRNKLGYLMKVESSNSLDSTPVIHLGENTISAIETLEDLINLCDNDVATEAFVKDAEEQEYYIKTSYTMAHATRKRVYRKSNGMFLKNSNMAGIVWISTLQLEEMIKALKKE